MKLLKYLGVPVLILTANTSFGQLINLNEVVGWLNSEKYPNIIFENLEDKKFKLKASSNFIIYTLESDPEGYTVDIPSGDDEILDIELDKFINVSREVTLGFLASQKNQYNNLKSKINDTCKLIKTKSDKIGKDTYSYKLFKDKTGIYIKVEDGFLSHKGMFYSIKFYKRNI
jgi:hypothetical protein